MKNYESYLNKIYNILEEIPFNDLAEKSGKKLFSTGDLIFNLNGNSVEFNQYSNYNNGESVKTIDWKQYAKTEKLYTKKYHSESNSKKIFIIDNTNSMNFKNKNEYAILLFGITAHILFSLKADVSVALNGDFSGFKKNTDDFISLLEFYFNQKEFEPVRTLNLLNEIKETQNSTVILISDFMFETDKLLKKVIQMKEFNYDFHFIQLLSDEELNLDYKGIVKFRDMETDETLITEPLSIKKIYQEELFNHNQKISNTLIENSMNYSFLNTSIGIKDNILKLFGG